ncbi:YtpI family protein [Chengkuizengella axinellae]|uniref:YtpI family protein n=1 Tax=Chengkuizengella axinellae TaxID=3064388 RepID=A0ABT9IYH1_9BACL|nr:YtpI family protein [Chengkuizengella sp. 2205SS18-9]MDP5274405.1 YtpI family protein [Chengkuizengella sp. 2205SS18-9]
MSFVNFIPIIIAFIAAWFSFYFSMKARRTNDVKEQGLMRARMNISIGIVLTTIACIQLFSFGFSWPRFIVGILFILLGFANLYGGIRNHKHIMNFKSQ